MEIVTLSAPAHQLLPIKNKPVAILQKSITLKPYCRGFHLVSKEILASFPELPENGIFHLFIKHTSAALTINENADPSVRIDFESSLNDLVKENQNYYTHNNEGSDDMPAHIKSSLLGSSLSIPITNHHLNLGIWQGIYLCEFRNNASSRTLVVTIYS